MLLATLSGDEDVIVLLAGAPHIYGLNQELGETFRGCQTMVVGNFQEMPAVALSDIKSVRDAQALSGRESCQAVADVVGFEVARDKQAIVPDVAAEALSAQGKKSFVEKLGGKKPEESEESWVNKVESGEDLGRV